MKKFIVTWTFMRHIHRHREYKLLTKIIEAESEYFADFAMINDLDVQALFKKGFDHKMKSYTCIDEYTVCKADKPEKSHKIPDDANDLHLFAIKPTTITGEYQAFIGYKIDNGSFHFIQIPVDKRLINK